MKKLFCLVVILLLFPVPKLSAHAGYQSYIQVNGKNTTHNPIYASSVEGFVLPHEQTSESYLVLQEISFAIDPSKMDKPLEDIKRMNFRWDFGDGEKTEGGRVEHVYKKIGTFVVTLSGQLDQNQEQTLTTIKLNILPLQNYKLPSAALSVNGQMVSQPKITQSFNQEFIFEVENIGTTSAKIVEYLWDLGDKSSTNETKVKHKYANDHFGANLILRVKDQNGFWTDQSIQLVNLDRQGMEEEVPVEKTLNKLIKPYGNYLIVAILGLSALGVIIFWVNKQRFMPKKFKT